MLKGKKILVTGGAGFIGSHLSEKIREMGNDVTILDNLTITESNLSLLESKGINKIIADISDYKLMLAEIKNFDIVFHLAAMNRAVKSIDNPVKSNLVNVTGTLNVLEACRKNGIKKLINISSSSVYGSSNLFPRKEENELKPTHPYAAGKLAGEHYARIYYELYGLETVTLRYFSVYGPRQLGTIEHAAVIPKFIHRILNNREIEIYGSGKQKRSFTYVGDTVDATIKASAVKEAVGNIFNISSEEEISISRLVNLIEEITGKKAMVKNISAINGEVDINPSDISKAKRILGFTAATSIREGLMKTVEWYKHEI